MNLTNTMICWDMGGNVALVPWPDRRGASDKFQRSTGACYDVVRGGDFEQRKCRAFIDVVDRHAVIERENGGVLLGRIVQCFRGHGFYLFREFQNWCRISGKLVSDLRETGV